MNFTSTSITLDPYVIDHDGWFATCCFRDKNGGSWTYTTDKHKTAMESVITLLDMAKKIDLQFVSQLVDANAKPFLYLNTYPMLEDSKYYLKEWIAESQNVAKAINFTGEYNDDPI
jgi:hypothetical protein